MTNKPNARPLRRGWTTGRLRHGGGARRVRGAGLGRAAAGPGRDRAAVGQRVAFALASSSAGEDFARAGVVKDAGDDPDVTHGALVIATCGAARRARACVFAAGEGVGTVTRPGLPLPPGEPAINPTPRKMMPTTIAEASAKIGVGADAQHRNLRPRRRGDSPNIRSTAGSASSAAFPFSARRESSRPFPAPPGSTASIAASMWRAPAG